MKKWLSVLLLVTWQAGGTGWAASEDTEPQEQPATTPSDANRPAIRRAFISEVLTDIGHRATRHADEPIIDIVFVVNGSTRMVPQVTAVERQFVHLLTALEKKTFEYRFALFGYRLVHGQPNTKVIQWTYDTAAMEKHLSYIRRVWKGDVESGYGLDALMLALNRFDMNPDAVTQFIIVTDAPMRTVRTQDGAKKRLIQDIINRCRIDNIQINFIGTPEDTQFELAYQTGGDWYPISTNFMETLAYGADAHRAALLKLGAIGMLANVNSSYRRLNMKIDKIFGQVSEHLIENFSNEDEIDIVFLFDNSLSMERRVDAICNGLDQMTALLDASTLNYRLGIIRFWAEVGVQGQSTVLVTKPPLTPRQVKIIMRRPKMGTEHLLDAIVNGVRKLDTPDEQNLVLIIITDEPTTGTIRQNGTVIEAIKTCQEARARVYVLGGLRMSGLVLDADRFQYRLAVLTRGLHYLLRGAPMFELDSE
ncbi:MAG: VWA domain-containing protein, partial [Rhodothermaceae bacterium]|nr:VWA domain-containing protein [Rhodothermaceae bacterium]